MKKGNIAFFGSLLASIFFFAFTIKKEEIIKLPPKFNDKFSFIPGGKIRIEKDSFEINPFFISKYEISNNDYQEFVRDITKSRQADIIKITQIDSLNWKRYNNEYVNYYYRHPAYNTYPVVNVNHESAELYCKWLTNKLNEHCDTTSIKLECRLPTRAEWIKAAKGGNEISPFAWNGPYLRDTKGQLLCNFKMLGFENIHFDEKTQTYQVIAPSGDSTGYSDITVPVKSYSPNNFGLYNMNGNVAEMIAKSDNIAVGGSWNSTGYDVNNYSIMTYKISSSMVGFRPVVIVKRK
jgi:sulfatase modifying factor 1